MPSIVNVPDVDGVPSVLYAAGAGQAIALMDADASPLFGAAFQQWGIYSGGAPVVIADTVTAFDYRQQWALSDYPVERGGFESFDKVATPFDARFQFVAGGSSAKREALLTSIVAIAGDLNLYDVVMPEQVYPNVNIVHYDFTRRTERGVSLLVVDVWAQEVRIAAQGAMSSTQSPSDAAQTNGGPVQAVTPGNAGAEAGGIGSDATIPLAPTSNDAGVPASGFASGGAVT